ncbi:hypothetical protein FEM03_10190 [Phragmitibacter flavus]|uniref:Uncharacterized protein n=1 Tax=Phragmitibacter flavus TaxID=2576071 RepID=A0A5R8KFC3_9BACT|nr:hypothetical protein [Phragmitibacter flavus]TLD70675.1 hypothetical protein FEM03_10190 [Phragmitibacter flavus]
MSHLISITVALLAGIIAFASMLLVALGIVDWYRIPSREGASGYFVVVNALLAGFIGTIIGWIVARKTGPGMATELVWAGGTNILLCALIALVACLFAPRQPEPHVETHPPTSPLPDHETLQKQRAQELFDAIPPNAPIPQWFPYTGEGGDLKLRATALQHILAKPGHIAEINALLISPDRPTAVNALRLVTQLPMPPAPELKAGVAACGSHLAKLIREVNATPEAEDPSYELAGETAVRFSSWIATARLLREPANGGSPDDFVRELLEILALSRARPEIHTMRQDILRVASHYAQEWAGIPPLPDDPPPR